MENYSEKGFISGSSVGDPAGVLRPYHEPRLTQLGAIQELVQGGVSGPLSDGGRPADASSS